MFERFTGHAQRVLELEGIEAQKMHHAHLGTEHLLLALVHGHQALEKLGVTLKQLRSALADEAASGEQTNLPEYFHQTDHAKHVMSIAVEEARALKSNHIGTEHLLLALLGEPEGVAFKTLERLNLTPDQVRQEVLAMLEAEGQPA
jgi:ATP-dependent Clp protease ATP-binding subunit ClpC